MWYCLKYDKNFLNIVKKILFFITQYGIKSFRNITHEELVNNKKTFNKFIKKVHEGFYNGQDLILEILLNLYKKYHKIKNMKKEFDIHKNKIESDICKYKLIILETKEKIIRKLADSIAWQIIKNQHYIARRLLINNIPTPIANCNIESTLNYITNFKKKYPCSFTLISDLTSFVHQGDMLENIFENNNKTFRIVELKEGKINKKHLEALDFFKKSNCGRSLYYYYNSCTKKEKKQLDRVIKQHIRGLNTLNVINNDFGFADDFKTELNIHEPKEDFKYFHETIDDMLKKLNNKSYEINVIDNCLYIGVYNNIQIANFCFNAWMKLINNKYPTYNYVNSFNTPLCIPIFIQPFNHNHILDLTFGKKIILMNLNYSALFEKLKKNGFEIDWVSKKESNKLKNENKDLLEINNQMIRIKNLKGSTIIGQGIISRIYNDFVTPISVFKSLTEVGNK